MQNHEHAFNSLCLGKLGKTHIDVAGIATRILQLIDTIGQPIDPLPFASVYPTICCLELLVEPFKGIAKVFPSHRGASSQCYWPPTGDCRLKTEADAIVLYCHSFIRFAVSAEAF